MRNGKRWLTALLAVGLVTWAGCNKPDAAKTASGTIKKEHSHPSHGPHKGALCDWGDEEYHAEFTVDHDKKEAVVYILDGTALKAPNVAADKITDVKLTINNVTPNVNLTLKHDPARSGPQGIAFAATHDEFGKKMEFKGIISGKVNGKDYTNDFEEKEHDHKDEKK
jgi:hypothetical protein